MSDDLLRRLETPLQVLVTPDGTSNAATTVFNLPIQGIQIEAATRIRGLEASHAAAEAAGFAKGLEMAVQWHLDALSKLDEKIKKLGPSKPESLDWNHSHAVLMQDINTHKRAHYDIRALSPSPSMVLVPREPSEAMLNAAADATDGQFEIDGDKGAWLPSSGFDAAYRAMIGAARE